MGMYGAMGYKTAAMLTEGCIVNDYRFSDSEFGHFAGNDLLCMWSN
jgi:hypothetical protein